MIQHNFFLFVLRPSSFVLEKKASWITIISFLSSFVLRPSSLRKKPHKSTQFPSLVLRPSSFVFKKKPHESTYFFYLSRSSFVLRHWEKRLLNQPNFFFFVFLLVLRRSPFVLTGTGIPLHSYQGRKTKDERQKKRRYGLKYGLLLRYCISCLYFCHIPFKGTWW